MSNTTTPSTQAPEEKKSGFKLVAFLLLVVSVAMFFLPLTYAVANSVEYWSIEAGKEQAFFKTLTDLLSAKTHVLGFIPSLIGDRGISEFYHLFTALMAYVFPVALAIVALLSLIALFSKKEKSYGLVRAALFIATWFSLAYAISSMGMIVYLEKNAKLKDVFDVWTSLYAVLSIVLACIVALKKSGKSAWTGIGHFIISLVAVALLMVGVIGYTDGIYFWAILAIAIVLLIVAFCRMAAPVNVKSDRVRSVFQFILILLACVIGAGTLKASKFLLFAILAVIVAAIELAIMISKLVKHEKAEIQANADAAMAEFKKVEYIEAYPYDGGPVAGVELAEEVYPTMAAISAAKDPDGTARATVATLLGNGFDAFLITLNEKEKEEFIDLYVLKCKGTMPEIPGYVVGGDNKDFFNKVFIYLGQYREKIPAALLSKMYKFSMKI